MSNVTHRVELPTKIQAVCGENSRYGLDNVFATPTRDNADGAWLAASNGKLLACVQVNGSTELADAIAIPPDALPTKAVRRGVPVKFAELNGEWRNSDSKIAPAVQDYPRFPGFADVLPEVSGKNVAVMKLDAKLLADLQTALCSSSDQDYLTLFIPIKSGMKVAGAIGVLGQHGIGAISTMNNDDTSKERYEARRAAFSESSKAGLSDYNQRREAFMARPAAGDKTTV